MSTRSDARAAVAKEKVDACARAEEYCRKTIVRIRELQLRSDLGEKQFYEHGCGRFINTTLSGLKSHLKYAHDRVRKARRDLWALNAKIYADQRYTK